MSSFSIYAALERVLKPAKSGWERARRASDLPGLRGCRG